MNIFETLKHEHRRIEELISRLTTNHVSPEAARRLFGGLKTTLEQHTSGEERCFYPALGDEHEDLIEEALADHERMSELLAEMEDLDPDSEEWVQCLDELDDLVKTHIELEEREIFALARRQLDDDQADQIGREMRDFQIMPRRIAAPSATPQVRI